MTIRKAFILAATLALAADVVTKLLAVSALEGRDVSLGFLNLHLVRNSGVAFGVGASLPSWVVLGVTTSVVLVLAVLVWRGQVDADAATGLIVGGALGNIGDRVIDGNVIDIFDLGWWPAFNVADVCIVLGVALVLTSDLRRQPATVSA